MSTRTTRIESFRFGLMSVWTRLKFAFHFCEQFAQGRFLSQQPLDHPHCVADRRRLAIEGPGDGGRTKPGALAAEIETIRAGCEKSRRHRRLARFRGRRVGGEKGLKSGVHFGSRASPALGPAARPNRCGRKRRSVYAASILAPS